VLEWIRSHRKVSKQAFLMIALVIVICLILSILIYFFSFTEPPEDQLVVAISPFYFIDNAGNFGHDILIADDLGRYEEVIAAYDKAIKIDSQYKEAWNNRYNPYMIAVLWINLHWKCTDIPFPIEICQKTYESF
jgi:tetratricopeptide (TPR) repeat protein